MALNENDRRVRELRNIHAGKTAFILGNGPSLKVGDLERLAAQITFASNKVYLAFDQTKWRPTYYTVADRLVAKNNAATIAQLRVKMIFSDQVRSFFPPSQDVIWLHETFRNVRVRGQSIDGGRTGYFSRDAMVSVEAGATVLYTQLQLAHYMGITRVYLLGLDFSFAVPKTTVATSEPGYEKALRSEGEVNHFHPEYRKPGEIWAVPDMEEQRMAFAHARWCFEQDGRQLLNASRQTKLDVIPRVDLDEVLAGLAPSTT